MKKNFITFICDCAELGCDIIIFMCKVPFIILGIQIEQMRKEYDKYQQFKKESYL